MHQLSESANLMEGAIRTHQLAPEQLGAGSVCHTVGDAEAGLWVLRDEGTTKASCPTSPGQLRVHLILFIFYTSGAPREEGWRQ